MSLLFHSQLKQPVRAFTLIETLVSIMIISVVILGPLTVAMGASAYARQTKDTMIATYLAQEALELLHHQQDSVFLRCLSGTDTSGLCTPKTNETISAAAWRIFQGRLGYNGVTSASCYDLASDPTHGSSSGCSYDFIDMATNEDSNPTKYSFSGSDCPALLLGSDNLYVCSGTPSHWGVTPTTFTRSVSIKTLPTPVTVNDNDLRVTVTVSFRRSTGYVRKIQVVDFLHAHA